MYGMQGRGDPAELAAMVSHADFEHEADLEEQAALAAAIEASCAVQEAEETARFHSRLQESQKEEEIMRAALEASYREQSRTDEAYREAMQQALRASQEPSAKSTPGLGRVHGQPSLTGVSEKRAKSSERGLHTSKEAVSRPLARSPITSAASFSSSQPSSMVRTTVPARAASGVEPAASSGGPAARLPRPVQPQIRQAPPLPTVPPGQAHAAHYTSRPAVVTRPGLSPAVLTKSFPPGQPVTGPPVAVKATSPAVPKPTTQPLQQPGQVSGANRAALLPARGPVTVAGNPGRMRYPVVVPAASLPAAPKAVVPAPKAVVPAPVARPPPTTETVPFHQAAALEAAAADERRRRKDAERLAEEERALALKAAQAATAAAAAAAAPAEPPPVEAPRLASSEAAELEQKKRAVAAAEAARRRAEEAAAVAAAAAPPPESAGPPPGVPRDVSPVHIVKTPPVQVPAEQVQERSQSEAPAVSGTDARGPAEVVRSLVALKQRYLEADPDGLLVCLKTLRTYVNNLAHSPQESKFQRISCDNNAFATRVARFEGAAEVLRACGFTESEGAWVVEPSFLKTKGSKLFDALTKFDVLIEQVAAKATTAKSGATS